MGLLNIIRRMKLREKQSIRETSRRERFTTGDITLPSSSANPVPCAMVHPSWNCRWPRQLQDQMLRRPGGDHEMADVLALVLHHDEQVVVRAVELALDAGVATKTHVLNLLHRLIDGKTTDGPDIDTPHALTLMREPICNDGSVSGSERSCTAYMGVSRLLGAAAEMNPGVEGASRQGSRPGGNSVFEPSATFVRPSDMTG
jgi:hypothetical protein